jgi:hypothetical protein
MLPCEPKPWQKGLARSVIVVTIIAAIFLAYYLHDRGMLYIPEVTIILLLLLAILPPNISVLRRKQTPDAPHNLDGTHPHTR